MACKIKLERSIVDMIRRKQPPEDIIVQHDHIHGNESHGTFEMMLIEGLDNHTDLIHYVLQEVVCGRLTYQMLQIIFCGAANNSDSDMLTKTHTCGGDVVQYGQVRLDSGAIIKRSPIMCATYNDNTDMLRKLLTLGKHNLVDITERSPLHYAALFGASRCLDSLLVDASVVSYINSRDKNGDTPLIIAARKHPMFIPTLLRYGAHAFTEPSRKGVVNNMGVAHIISSHIYSKIECYPNYVRLLALLMEAGLEIRTTCVRNSVLWLLCEHIKENLGTTVKGIDATGNTNEVTRFSFAKKNTDKSARQLNLYIQGSDVRDCVRYVCSVCPPLEFEYGIKGAINQLFYIINIEWLQKKCSLSFLDLSRSYLPVTKPMIHLVHDIVRIILSHKQDIHPQNLEKPSQVEILWKCILTNHKSKLALLSDSTFKTVYFHALMSILDIMKTLVSLERYRAVQGFKNLAALLVIDIDLYLPFLEVHLHNLDSIAYRDVLRTLVATIDEDVFCQLGGEDKKISAKRVLLDKLQSPLTLKCMCRRRILKCVGGDCDIKVIGVLPLPKKLVSYIMK